jgi:hypothetical protein
MHADWTDRMLSAWVWIGEEERKVAAALYYDVYQNFWPDLGFYASDLDEQSLNWVFLLSNPNPASHSTPADVTLH